MQNNTVLETLSSSCFLSDLILTIKAGNFITPSRDPGVDENTRVIGEMKDLEKALYTLITKYELEEVGLKIKIGLLRDEPDIAKTNEALIECDILQKKVKNATSLFWNSIWERFEAEYFEVAFNKQNDAHLLFYPDFSIALKSVSTNS